MNKHKQPHNRFAEDELDALLRAWHEVNADRAAAGRDVLIAQLRSTSPSLEGGGQGVGETHVAPVGIRRLIVTRLAAALRSPVLRAAASLALACTLIALFIPFNNNTALARQEVILAPEAGRLDALDDRGQLIGPCALKHTDVSAAISGPFSRVTVAQNYHNPYNRKIEAVYTFPLSNRAAVDRMTMTVKVDGQPDRIIEGEVKERQQARQIYESARAAGYVASLLEQDRPNIFTQSVANIEPNAQVIIEISYVEMVQQRDGEYTFDFPMVVAPRYIPGRAVSSIGEANAGDAVRAAGALPNELERREGAILLGPAAFERQKVDIQGAVDQGNFAFNQTPVGPAPYLQRVFDAAVPILPPEPAYRQREDVQALYRANPNYDFNVLYADGSREFGQIAGDGLGHVNGRWFYFDPAVLAFVQREEASVIGGSAVAGTAFAPNSDQVPDASRITPMPVKPPMRAGHDISLKVSINTGEFGPAIIDYKSDLHEIICTDPPTYRSLGNKINLALKDQKEIPNRDFVLRWRSNGDAIQEAVLTHADPKWIDRAKLAGAGAGNAPAAEIAVGGGFFTMIIAPPQRVGDADAIPRELVFVLDTSGSMQGQPIEKAKDVMRRAIDAMRPLDTFNLITFSGDTRILWKTPRPNTDANRAEAQAFLAGQSGSGGTEMMTAINAALAVDGANAAPAFLTPAQLADLPADGRDVTVRTRLDDIEAIVMKSAVMEPFLRVRPDLALKTTSFHFPVEQMGGNPTVDLAGKWATINGERVFQVASATRVGQKPDDLTQSMRIVMFLTDGQVGNDDAIIAAVREHARTTRVFSFGIGDSPNRYLLDGMAQAGRGEVEYVNLNNQADEAVARFTRRIACPLLRDVQITLSEGLHLIDTIPSLDAIPDLWDVKPLIVHGRYTIENPLPPFRGERGDGRVRGEGDDHAIAPDITGKITLTGKTARGEYRRELDVTLPQRSESNPMLPAVWARARVDQMLAGDDGVRRSGQVTAATPDTQNAIIALGERYHIASNFTSFVAVEKTRVTVAGQSVLVPVPIELAHGESWEGNFGCDMRRDAIERARLGLLRESLRGEIATRKAHKNANKDASDAQKLGELDDQARRLDERIATFGQTPEEVRYGLAVDASLQRIRELQLEHRYEEALQVVNEVLFIDAQNASALALRDVIATTMLYRDRAAGAKLKELGMGSLDLENQRSLVLPRTNLTGPGRRSDGLVTYPVDWPQTNARRGLTPTDAALVGHGGVATGARQPSIDEMYFAFSVDLPWDQAGVQTLDGAHSRDGFAPIGLRTRNDVAFVDQWAAGNYASTFAGVATAVPALSGGSGGGFGGGGGGSQGGSEGRVLTGDEMFIGRGGRQLQRDPSTGRLVPAPEIGADFGGAVTGTIAGTSVDEMTDYRKANVLQSPIELDEAMRDLTTPVDANLDAQARRALAEELTRLGEAHSMAWSGREQTRLGIIPDKTIVAHVVRVDNSVQPAVVEIDAGQRQGMKKDWLVTIGDGGTFIATVRVKSVDLDRCLGEVTLQKGTIAAGQLAVLFADREDTSPTEAISDLTAQSTQCDRILATVRDTINPTAWRENGGSLVEASAAQCVFNFRTLQNTPEAVQTIDRARGLVMMLAAAIPEIADIAKVDLPPSKPFDPVNDVDRPAAFDPNKNPAMDGDLASRSTLIIYDTRDLIAAVQIGEPALIEDDAAARIAGIITTFIDPSHWRDNGGQVGRVQTLKGNLIITTTPANQQAIGELLSQVRAVIAARNPGEAPAEPPVFKGLDGGDAVKEPQPQPAPQPPTQPAAPPADDEAVVIKVYDIRDMLFENADLAPPPPRNPNGVALTRADLVGQIVNILQENIDPENWRAGGGEKSDLRELASTLIITTSNDNHREIRALLDLIRPPTKTEQAAIEAARLREERLHRVIDARLRHAAALANPAQSDDEARKQPLELPATQAVIVLVRSIDDPTLAALTKAGLRIDDRNARMNIVAGEIDSAKLIDLALLESVRRIEPIEVDK